MNHRMSIREWMHSVRIWLGSFGAPGPSGAGGGSSDGAAMLRGMAGHSPEMNDVQEQVASERQARIVLASRSSELLCWLLGALREQEPPAEAPAVAHEGFFTLVTLPEITAARATHESGGHDLYAPYSWAQADVTDAVQGVDLILFLAEDVHPAVFAWPAADDRWFARLRSSAAPVLPLLVGMVPSGNEPAAPEVDMAPRLESLRRHLGVKPMYLPRCQTGAGGTAEAFDELVNRVLELRPRLAIALAQEVPSCRQLIAQRVVRSAAFMAALLGIEPLPLIDLPLTVLVQWKMALQIAAIYGRSGVEVFSREMVGTVGLNLLVRALAQQALKLLPVLGWLLSSALNFSTTWLLGQALIQAYAAEGGTPAQARLAGLQHTLQQRLRLPLLRKRKDGEDV